MARRARHRLRRLRASDEMKSGSMSRVQRSFLLLVTLFLRTHSTMGQALGGTSSAAAQDNAFQRGLVALRDDHLETALKELTSAEQASPSDARIRNFRGVTLVRLGRNDEAVSEYSEALRLDPAMEDAYRNLGLLEWSQHRLDAAGKDLRHALELAPDDSFAHFYLGRVLLDSREYSEAMSELQRSSMALPEDADFLIELATAYGALGQHDRQNRTMDRLLATQLNSTQSITVADLLLSAGRTEAAISLFHAMSKDQKDHASWTRFDLARVYIMAQDFQNAAVQAREYLESLPKDASPTEISAAWSLLGIAEANQKHADAAVSAFRKASGLQPNNEEYCLNLTRELMELTHYDAAISAIQVGLASNPKSYALNLRLGAAYVASAHYVEAEKAFRQLVEASDPLPISYVGLAQVLLRTGRAEEAATELAAAERELGPSFLLAYFRGLALKQAGKREEAAAEFTQAVHLNPSSAEAHRDLGNTLLILGRVNDAIPELKESLDLGPNDVRTRRLLSQAYARSGDMKTARQYLEAEIDPPVPITGLQGDFILPAWQYPQEEKRN